MSGFITHTFCECGENHKGMQQLGSIAAQGVPMADLRALAQQRPDLFQIVDFSHGGVEACPIKERRVKQERHAREEAARRERLRKERAARQDAVAEATLLEIMRETVDALPSVWTL